MPKVNELKANVTIDQTDYWFRKCVAFRYIKCMRKCEYHLINHQ